MSYNCKYKTLRVFLRSPAKIRGFSKFLIPFITTAEIGYDTYGNPVSKKDALGKITYTDYDGTYHTFPYKVRQDVSIASWPSGTVHDNWLTDPEPTATTQIEANGYTLYNSNGTVWIEVDKEGYAVEHFYDMLGTEIETVQPDGDDLATLPGIIEANNGNPNEVQVAAFCTSRENNPGARIVIDYQKESVKSYADVDKSVAQVKVTGVKKDGLGNVEREIEYGESESEYSVKKMTYDALGRMVGLTDPDAGASFSTVTVNGTDVEKHDKTWLVKYDDLGRKIRVAYPQTEAGKTANKIMSYDDVLNIVTTIDPEGRKVTERRDWNGNLVEVIAYGDSTTSASERQTYSYTYDRLGRKTSFTDPRNIVTTYKYDERNLLLEEVYSSTPLSGEGTGKDAMTYNDLGQLVRKKDPKGQLIDFTYDELGRNTSVIHYKSESDFPDTIARRVDTIYDNRGNAVRISNCDLIEHYIYDHSNRVTTLERRLKTQTVRQDVATVWGGTEADQVFGFDYSYNDAGMVKTMTYPDGSVHQFAYDPTLARLATIEEKSSTDPSYNPFVTNFDYMVSGVVTRMDYANLTKQEWQFDNRKRISHIKVTGPSEIVIEDLAYKINGSGDILGINDNEYKYDGFDRIIGAKTRLPGVDDKVKLVGKHFGTYNGGGTINGESYNALADLDADSRVNGKDHLLASLIDENTVYDIESFEYDKNGNRTKLTQNGDTYRYEYGNRNKLNKVWKKKKGATTEKAFAEYLYDENGNTKKRTIYPDTGSAKIIDFEYDTMNRLVKTTEGAKVCEYVYDNAGNRFIKKDDSGTSLYLRHGQIAVAMDVEVNLVQTTDKGKINRYVLSGDLLAGRVTVTVHAVGDPTTTKSWYHLDHLNSTKVVTDATAAVEVRYVYRAFGEQLKRLDASGADTTDKAKYSYGGKELDDDTNLYYFNARYYDATIGRFINVDPIQDGSNWYVYCNNNPLSFKDITGLETNGDFVDDVLGAINSFAKDTQDYAHRERAKAGWNPVGILWYSVMDALWVGVDIVVPDDRGEAFLMLSTAGLGKAAKITKSEEILRYGKGLLDDILKAGKSAIDDTAGAAKVFEGTAAPWESGATPNSIYVQLTNKGLTKTVTTYDNLGNAVLRTDFIQDAKHFITVNGNKINAANYIHQHTKLSFVSPEGNTYLKNMIRIVDENLKPLSEWVNVK